MEPIIYKIGCYLSAKQVIERRQCARSYLWNDYKIGKFPPPLVVRSKNFWPDVEVDVWLRAEMAGASDEELSALTDHLVELRHAVPVSDPAKMVALGAAA